MKSILTDIIIYITILSYAKNAIAVCVNKTHFHMTSTTNTAIKNAWFYNCTGACYINISDNEYETVDNSSFDTLWNVQILNLSNNKISHIGEKSFVIMRNLSYLNLNQNNLVQLPMDIFANKHNLISVDLSHNSITHIPLPVFNYSMSKIKEVILHHNQITAFEPWAYVKQALRLDLSYNNVSTFTNNYNWKYDSREVYDGASTNLQYNSVSEWHDWFLLQYKGQDANVAAALVELLPDIRNNPLTCDCNAYNMIMRVRESFFKWADSEYLQLKCFNPPHLRNKRAFYDVAPTELVCNITKDCPIGCLCQERSEERILDVDCQGRNLTSLPDVLPKSPYLIRLKIGNNTISIFDNRSYFKFITNMSMPDNMLTTLPDFFVDEIVSKENAFIDFRNNFLSLIPSGAQNIKFQDALFNGNNLECGCDMLWMVNWINLAPTYVDKSLNCTFKGEVHKIIDLNDNILNCNNIGNFILIVVLSVLLLMVIALLITAKRCPYETKILLFKILRIHPYDRYEVDKDANKAFDMYVSFDENDPYVRQWVIKILFKQLKEKKPFYNLCVAIRNAPAGPEAESRLQLIDQSRRLLIIISSDYDSNHWCQYELCHSETLEQNKGRIIYLLYDKTAEEIAKKEPWLSKMTDRKFFNLKDKMLWAKLRYELPINPLPEMPMKRKQPQEFTNI